MNMMLQSSDIPTGEGRIPAPATTGGGFGGTVGGEAEGKF
jgi:hypothetical protein